MNQVVPCTPESQEEVKKKTATMVVDVQVPGSITNVVDITRYSTMRKLVIETA